MSTKHTETVRFGRKKAIPPKKDPMKAANLSLAGSVLVMGIFFIGILANGSPSSNGELVESVFNDSAIPVMSTADHVSAETEAIEDIREILRKNVRDTSAEPFGYMNGRWNLWEYLGDVMAELLIGG